MQSPREDLAHAKPLHLPAAKPKTCDEKQPHGNEKLNHKQMSTSRGVQSSLGLTP